MNDTTETTPIPDSAEGAAVEVEKSASGDADASLDPSAETAPAASLRASSAVEKRMGQPQQGEMPFAVVLGEALTELPKDLYIPPRAKRPREFRLNHDRPSF